MFLQIFSVVFVIGVAFALLTLAASFLRFQWMTQRLHEAAEEEVGPFGKFRLKVVEALGSLHQTPAPFSILFVEPVWPHAINPATDSTAIQEARRLLDSRLQEGLRATDTVIELPDEKCWAILGEFGRSPANAIVQRLNEQAEKKSLRLASGQLLRVPWRIGMVHYPEHGPRADALIATARTAMESARNKASAACVVPPLPPEAPSEIGDDSADASPPPKQISNLIDPLTGVLRAERLGTALQKLLSRQRKAGLGASVIQLMIDGMDQYHRHYGQDGVDHILKRVADILATETRETDILARSGTSGFVVVMDCPPKPTLAAAQRLINQIKRLPIRVGSVALKVSACAGVAGYPDHSGYPRELLAFAEVAMETARNRGRSMAVGYQAQMLRQESRDVPVDRF